MTINYIFVPAVVSVNITEIGFVIATMSEILFMLIFDLIIEGLASVVAGFGLSLMSISRRLDLFIVAFYAIIYSNSMSSMPVSLTLSVHPQLFATCPSIPYFPNQNH